MQVKQLRTKVSQAATHERRFGSLGKALSLTLEGLGKGADPGAVEECVSFVTSYIGGVPEILGSLQEASRKAGLSKLMKPLLDTGERFFLHGDPSAGIRDEVGLMGVMDNAYLAYSLLFSGSEQEWPPEWLQAHRIVRALIGEQLASQLDGAVASALRSAQMQRVLETLKSGTEAGEGGNAVWTEASDDLPIFRMEEDRYDHPAGLGFHIWCSLSGSNWIAPGQPGLVVQPDGDTEFFLPFVRFSKDKWIAVTDRQGDSLPLQIQIVSSNGSVYGRWLPIDAESGRQAEGQDAGSHQGGKSSVTPEREVSFAKLLRTQNERALNMRMFNNYMADWRPPILSP